jgi:hypothetical protein
VSQMDVAKCVHNSSVKLHLHYTAPGLRQHRDSWFRVRRNSWPHDHLFGSTFRFRGRAVMRTPSINCLEVKSGDPNDQYSEHQPSK